jgi:hypothetical protein
MWYPLTLRRRWPSVTASASPMSGFGYGTGPFHDAKIVLRSRTNRAASFGGAKSNGVSPSAFFTVTLADFYSFFKKINRGV